MRERPHQRSRALDPRCADRALASRGPAPVRNPLSGEMDDRIGATQDRRVRSQGIPFNDRTAGRQAPLLTLHIAGECDDRMPGRQKIPYQRDADKSGCACDDDSHDRSVTPAEFNVKFCPDIS